MSKIPSGSLRLDEADIPIIRAFFMDARYVHPGRSEIRESISRISERLEIAESTVRKRVGKYVRSGFVTGWSLIMNPHITGEFMAQVRLDVLPPPTKDDVLEKLKLIEGVWVLVRYHDNVLGVGVYSRSIESLKKTAELMAKIANSEHMDYGQLTFPPCSHHFTPTDIDIIRIIQENPKEGLGLVADKVGRSIKTVKRRIDRMVSERAIAIAPQPDLGKLTGVIPAELWVFYSNPEVAKVVEPKVLSIAGNRACFVLIRNSEHTWLELLLMSVREGDEILAAVRKLKGIRVAYLDLGPQNIGMYKAFKGRVDQVAKQFGVRAKHIGTTGSFSHVPRESHRKKFTSH
jgi:DNA-binding Lrp family transcriptional regulator